MSQDIDDFLTDMTRLAKKYKVVLTACSCCDGVHVEKLGGYYPEGGEYTVEIDKTTKEFIWFGWTGGEE